MAIPEPARLLAFVSLLLVGPQAGSALAQTWHTDIAAAERQARELDVPLLLHFHADWCGPCRKMDRTVLTGADVASRLGKSVVGVKINADHHKNLVSLYNVRALPSDVVVDPAGQLLVRSEGAKQAWVYTAWLDGAGSQYERSRQARLASTTTPKVIEPAPGTAGEPAPAPEVPATTVAREAAMPEIAPRAPAVAGPPMLDGYSPVALAESRRWIEGKPEFSAVHDGMTYLLASAEEMQAFVEAPQRFAPQLLGCDPVVLQETDRALEGSTRFGAYFDGHLYLFTSTETRSRFHEEPYRYTRTEHVLRADQVTRRQ